MKAAVVMAMRRRRPPHRPSVTSIIPATAGPVAARPDQKTRFTRKIAQVRRSAPPAIPRRNASAPRPTRIPSTRTIVRELSRVPAAGAVGGLVAMRWLLLRDGPHVVDEVPALAHGDRLAVGGHEGAAVADVVGDVPVGAPLDHRARQVGRRDEPRRDRAVPLAAAAVAGRAIDPEEDLTARHRLAAARGWVLPGLVGRPV